MRFKLKLFCCLLSHLFICSLTQNLFAQRTRGQIRVLREYVWEKNKDKVIELTTDSPLELRLICSKWDLSACFDHEILTWLVSIGIDINTIIDDDKNTLLHEAAYRGLATEMAFLVRIGADRSLVNDQGKTPIDIIYNR